MLDKNKLSADAMIILGNVMRRLARIESVLKLEHYTTVEDTEEIKRLKKLAKQK